MACPFVNDQTNKDESHGDYSSYLNLRDLLGCTNPTTGFHDEHMFIVVHQVYELWFKQIIFEIDSIRHVLSEPPVDERNMFKISSRLSRIVKIFEILIKQMKVVETITPLDFAKFRGELGTASGFQSWQFRLLENKLGVRNAKRVKYNKQKYSDILDAELREIVDKSESEPSLFDLINGWLERTLGLTQDYNFWTEFVNACQQWFSDDMKTAENEKDPDTQKMLMVSCKKDKEPFDEIIVKENYDVLVARGDRSLSWEAFKGALMILYNREEIRFHAPFQILTLLMDLDSLITKWRLAHVLMVQRQIGSKMGTGGSSGYRYLRSTLDDKKYRPFLDLFQLSSYLIPSKYIKGMRVRRSTGQN